MLDLLTETRMLDCKPVETSMEMNHKLGILPDQAPTDKGRYLRLVGRLIYLSHTRLDISYTVSVVSQFMHAPSGEHMEAVYRILRYLKSAPGKGLLFSKNGISNIKGYTDSDWEVIKQPEGPHLVTLLLWKVILSLGKARSRR